MDSRTIARLGMRVLRRQATEAIYLKTGMNFTRPSDIRATLTERCNYRCRYCHHWRQDSYPEEMSLEQWQNALRSLREFVGYYTVQFLGGEPTLWPGFFDLVAFCREEDIGWGTITNGSTLTERNCRRIADALPQNFDVSIDSTIAAEHDWLRGVPNSLSKVMAGVDRLAAARARSGDFPIRLKPTVTRQTIASLPDLVRWATSRPGVYVDCSPVRLWRDAERKEMYPQTAEDMAVLRSSIAALIKLKHEGAAIETSVEKLEAIESHFMGEAVQHGTSACRVSLRSLDIRPNGDVNHCWKYSRIGNVGDASPRDIWAHSARKAVTASAVACPLVRTTCSTACTTHRSLAQEVSRGLTLVAGR